MMQSNPPQDRQLHVAVIPDGNGRWARERGLPRSAGHRAGARAVRTLVEAALGRGIATLTIFAFSADNWRRPEGEVDALMRLFEHFLDRESKGCREQGVRINVIGREAAERSTRRGETLLLRIAVDYSARESLENAAVLLAKAGTSAEDPVETAFEAAVAEACHSLPGVPPVDLVIRTSGEKRLSDFLLWESAYAELFFTPVLWPDFRESDLDAALGDYLCRERRFGALPAPEAPTVPAPENSGGSRLHLKDATDVALSIARPAPGRLERRWEEPHLSRPSRPPLS